MKCDHCAAAMINGVFCHETGCPVAWEHQTRTCRLCGDHFQPDHDRADTCPDCADHEHAGHDPDPNTDPLDD